MLRMKRCAVGVAAILALVSASLAAVLSSGSVARAQNAILQTGAHSAHTEAARNPGDWPVFGGGPGNEHYSSLAQIDRANVARLKVAWTFDTGEQGGLQTNPLVIDGILYACTPSQKVIALDAATGRLLWKFDSGIKGTQPVRGLSWWSQGGRSKAGERRLFAGVMNYLYALDPATGRPIRDFGENGRIDLRKGLRKDFEHQFIALTSPGLVYRDLIIVGGRNPETHPAPPGDVRAFDVRTGKLRWDFHTIPRPGEYGYDTWPKDAWQTAGAANNWAGMSLDEQRGIVYVPTGSAVSDFYGADRVGDDLFADTLLALDAATGKRLWHFQGVHHDIWDRDFPSAPVLLSVRHDGRRVDAVAQTTKQGYVYLFDRVTGQPLFPIQKMKSPASDVPGEVASPTQPKPVLPVPFARQILTEDMLTNRSPEAHQFALEKFRTYRSEGQFVPLSVDKDTIVFPGFDGGAEWGGPAVDEATGVLYVNANEMASVASLTENRRGRSAGETTYDSLCVSCHGERLAGSPPAFPSLVGIGKRRSDEEIASVIRQGEGRMPAFPMLDSNAIQELARYLKTADVDGGGDEVSGKEIAASRTAHGAAGKTAEPVGDRAKYRFTGYRKFLDEDGYPAVAPPWGTLSAIDLNTGQYLWKVPLGNYPALAAKGMADTGSENYGGPVVTAGGLVLIGATDFDRAVRAFDSHTGKLLWQASLPFSGTATPATYMAGGRQYVVIAAGGGRDGKASGGVYVAFALLRK